MIAANKLVSELSARLCSDERKDWKVVFNESDATDDNYNYVILNLK